MQIDNLKKENEIISNIIFDKETGLLDKIEFFQSNIDDSFCTLLQNSLTNRRSLSSQDKFNILEIGMNDSQLYIGLFLLSQKYKNEKIILKLFNYYPFGLFGKNYFQIESPNYNTFILKSNMDQPKFENKLVITPLILNSHYSLLLFYNKQIFLLDFGLQHCFDDTKSQLRTNLFDSENQIGDKISIFKEDIKQEIYFLIDSYTSDENLKKGLKNLLGIEDEILFNLIKKYLLLENQLNNYKEIENKSSQGDFLIFNNKELCRNIKIINCYRIQGEQTCAYYCLAAYKCIIANNYSVKDIMNLCKNCTLQIKISKIMIEEFFNDKQEIFKINEDMLIDDYKIFNKNENVIGIKKKINNIQIQQREDMVELNNTEIIDIKNIENMLTKQGYKQMIQSYIHK